MFRKILLVASIFILLATPAFSASCLEAQQAAAMLKQLKVLNSWDAELKVWHVTMNWYEIPQPQKEMLVGIFAGIRNSCEGKAWVIVKDSRGNKVAEYNEDGLEIER